MRKYKISYGNSCHAKNWHNSCITWEELCEKLKTTVHTRETVAEFKVMSRDDRSAAKDKGGFVGGHLKDGRRKKENVICRSLLTLDADHAEPGFIERFAQGCEYSAVIYTTHSHTPEHPRARIVIPLSRDVSPDCYIAIARLFADSWSIDVFDECSYKVNQLMYWPTTPSDGEYICRITEGEALDPDLFLANYPNWQDCLTLPTSCRENRIKVSDRKKQEDPLTKDGIVGAFCRTYTIQDAIEKYLSDVYEPSVVEGRYNYIPAESSAGVIIYDEKFAYSHHATDPACGKLLNAFDLVRIHRFKDDDNNSSYTKMCAFAENDNETKKTLKNEALETAQKEFSNITSNWEEPLPFGKHKLLPFPVDALPDVFRDYTTALSESLQTPIDMAGCTVLSIIATCIQGKYSIKMKSGWSEPLNIYTLVIAPPSDRKSAVQHACVEPVNRFEEEFNKTNAAMVESNHMQQRILQRRQKTIEEQISKGKADQTDLEKIAREIADFTEMKPLRLYADDITPEKLVSVLSENNGRMALLSSEAGIFDTLSGAYSKFVNIDVLLKSYSGDAIRVERIGRERESISHPTLTILLMTQPSVISKVLSNETFRGRGLTARFLYSMPTSMVGCRNYRSAPIPDEVNIAYEQQVKNMLEDEYSSSPEVITLSEEADRLLEAFAQYLEPKLISEYAEMSDWCGKLVGNVARIAGLLCRAGVRRDHDFEFINKQLVVDGHTMKNAIRLGEYFLNHAQAVFNVMPENTMFNNARRILKMIRDKGLKEFNRRTAMRYCGVFKRVDEIQPVLDFLEDYGYIASVDVPQSFGKGRPPMPKYVVNPLGIDQFCRFDTLLSKPHDDKTNQGKTA